MSATSPERRHGERRSVPDRGLGAEATDRRQRARRRGDARSVEEILATEPAGTIVKTFSHGGARPRQSVVYACGCVAVDGATPDATLHLLACPTHAALRVQLRRRQSDRH
jgi:hypothetical protein